MNDKLIRPEWVPEAYKDDSVTKYNVPAKANLAQQSHFASKRLKKALVHKVAKNK